MHLPLFYVTYAALYCLVLDTCSCRMRHCIAWFRYILFGHSRTHGAKTHVRRPWLILTVSTPEYLNRFRSELL